MLLCAKPYPIEREHDRPPLRGARYETRSVEYRASTAIMYDYLV